MRSQSLRILFVGPMLGRHPGWVPNPVEELAPQLEERGYSCILVSNKLNRFHRLADILAAIFKYRRQVDVICLQVYGGPSFIVEDLASMLGGWLGLPVVMHLHGGSLPDFVKHFPRWTRRVFKRAKVIVAPSGYLLQTMQTIELDAEIIPNGLDLSCYPFRTRKEPKPHLLWMRTFHDIYNPLLAVDAFKLIKREYPQARLTMAGQEKGLLEVVKKRVKDLGLSDSVRFAGFLDMKDKQCEFAEHDIFLNTNRIDNMPISVIEAAAAGMLIVATAVGGVPYLLQDGKNGLLVPNGEEKDTAQAVRRIMGEPGLAVNLSNQARALAEDHDWTIVLPRWETLFQEVTDHSL